MSDSYLRYASLGSGSSGNATVIEARCAGQTTRLLLDCGFSVRDTEKRLARLNLTGADIDALLITHEHEDHIGGAARFVRKYGCDLYMSRGTYFSVRNHATRSCANLDVRFCTHNQMLNIGVLQILPYTVPHDAREPLQFVFEMRGADCQRRLGILTDAGHVSPLMVEVLQGCHALTGTYDPRRQIGRENGSARHSRKIPGLAVVQHPLIQEGMQSPQGLGLPHGPAGIRGQLAEHLIDKNPLGQRLPL